MTALKKKLFLLKQFLIFFFFSLLYLMSANNNQWNLLKKSFTFPFDDIHECIKNNHLKSQG